MVDKVKIDQVLYSITRTAGPILVENKACCGAITYNQNEIEVLTALGKSAEVVTLVHEIVHGITYERGINTLIKDESVETFTEEMAKGIIQLIRDNPDLVNYVSGK